MLKLFVKAVLFAVLTIASAAAQDVVVVMDTSTAQFAAKTPLSPDDVDAGMATLPDAQTALLAGLGDLTRGRGARQSSGDVLIFGTHAALLSATTARALYDTDPESFIRSYAPQEGLCASLAPVFQSVQKEIEARPDTTKTLITYIPFLDVTDDYCYGGVASTNLFTEGVKDEYQLDKIVSDETLKTLVLVGVWVDKRPNLNAYINQHKHDGLNVRFLTLEQAVTEIDAILRSDQS